MNLTELQRTQLGTYAEWRDIQYAMFRIYSYLGHTKLEDVQFQILNEDLDSISMRRAAFLEQFTRNQGGA